MTVNDVKEAARWHRGRHDRFEGLGKSLQPLERRARYRDEQLQRDDALGVGVVEARPLGIMRGNVPGKVRVNGRRPVMVADFVVVEMGMNERRAERRRVDARRQPNRNELPKHTALLGDA